MPFDDPTRNELQKVVAKARDLLIEEFTSQCQRTYGIQPSGLTIDVAKLDHLPQEEQVRARLLRDRIDHLAAGAIGPEGRVEAVERLIREQGFTVLNRLCALRMCEERGLVQECVRLGYDSKGFRLYDEAASKLGGDTYTRYSLFLQLLFDEISVDLGVLFDRFALTGLLFPGEDALKQALALINTSKLSHIWIDDEAIGWVYQYFNSSKERKAMRDASAIPRDSRELAVRNQFFTPRYVVEFLTDGTLGRLWYEMRKGNTGLKKDCRYLMGRTSDVFLSRGEVVPLVERNETGFSQEELLRNPAYLVHRPKVDPRDLRVLDPACGSGHFLLYAFDLLERIYEEAWADPESPESKITGRTLRDEFTVLDDLHREVPKFIIEHNLHGIDIDPRAVQIAALALWLRAQKSWKSRNLEAGARPKIDRSNIVTAEPMPGEGEMLREFTAALKPRVLGQLVDVVFEKMQLAGESGSLLKIDEEIRQAIGEARRQWLKAPEPEQQLLFPGIRTPRPVQQVLRFDLSGVTDESFWQQAEERILTSLKEYAEMAENGENVSRRLFAEDAARGFAFIDLCHKRYDIVLMNPPFGSFSKRWSEIAKVAYRTSCNDILAAFVERFLQLLNFRGFLGAITSRTCFFLQSFTDWRRTVLLQECAIHGIADLGQGVMDDAMVEAAAYILEKSQPNHTITVSRAIADPDRKAMLDACIDSYRRTVPHSRLFFADPKYFHLLPDSPFVYWLQGQTIRQFKATKQFEADVGVARNGMTTGDDPRWVRAVWEVPYENTIFCYYPANGDNFCSLDDPIVQAYLLRQKRGTPRWGFFVKAGASQPWYSPITLKVNWARNGIELRNFRDAKGKPRAFLRSRELYYRSGFSWTRRAVRFYPYVIPSSCIPSVSRYMAFPNQGKEVEALGFCASRMVSAFLRFYAEFWQRPNFLVGTLKVLPWPDIGPAIYQHFSALIEQQVEQRRVAYQNHEPFHDFLVPSKIRDFSRQGEALAFHPEALLDEEGERMAAEAYGFTPEQAKEVERDLLEAIAFQRNPSTSDDSETAEADEDADDSDFVLDFSERASEEAYVSYVVGCVFGRWDMRMALDESLCAKLPHPFDPHPVCPPGMLIGPDGLPAEPGCIVSEEWLRKRVTASTLPAEGTVKEPMTDDSDYPVQIAWHGVLVDDPGYDNSRPHKDDIVLRVREVFELLLGEVAPEAEQNACKALGVSNLRDYFRKPSGFFQDHLTRYSKSRRKAPIYLPVSTESGTYTMWLYYPRLSERTLYNCVNDYVDPKLKEIENDLDRLRRAPTTTRKGNKHIDDLVELQKELQMLREQLLQIAALPYKPDHNDGLLISAAPLWKLFRNRPWQTALRKCWEELKTGKHEWTHLAHAIWPDRVLRVCRKDKSVAIAHGLEDVYEA